MSISPDDQLWYDHGTGEGGDSITFLEKAFGISNDEACRLLRELAELGAMGEAPPISAKAEFTKASINRRSISDQPSFRLATSAEIDQLSKLRNIQSAALLLAQERGILRFGEFAGHPAWFITDPGYIIQARRQDGALWDRIGSKAWNSTGSHSNHPVGIRSASAPAIALVEGGPDLLAAYMFIMIEGKLSQVSPVGMLGASCYLPTYSLQFFRGKAVRIFPHLDSSGLEAATRWTAQLHHVARKVEWFNLEGIPRRDGQAVTDLNDLCYVDPAVLALHGIREGIMP